MFSDFIMKTFGFSDDQDKVYLISFTLMICPIENEFYIFKSFIIFIFPTCSNRFGKFKIYVNPC